MVICLRDMFFHAYHGVLEEEQTEGNTFRVTVRLWLDDMVLPEDDDISQTVDFRDVYAIVKGEMGIRSNLLEHLSWRIHDDMLMSFPQVSKVQVIVGKKNPKLGGEVGWEEVEI